MTNPRKRKWNGWRSVYHVLLLLFILVIFGPFLMQLPYVGYYGSHSASCQSNLKQLGLAIAEYEQDNGGAEPPVSTVGIGWREAVYPYVKSTGVYECPDDIDRSHPTSPMMPRSYSANHLGQDSQGNERGAFSAPGDPQIHANQLVNPATTILLADTRGYLDEEWNMVSPTFLPQPNVTRELYTHVPRHLFFEHPMGTLNVLLADGHVKHLYPMNTLTPVNLWTRDNAPFNGQDLANAQAILRHAAEE